MSRAMIVGIASSLMIAGCTPWQPAFDERVDAMQVASVAIAPLDEALTFARTQSEPEAAVLAVTAYAAGRVDAVDLSALLGAESGDAIELFRRYGYDGLRQRISAAPAAVRRQLGVEELGVPIDLGDAHVAVGTNYPEHAADAGTVHPFLFPKLVRPTVATATVAAGEGLLDYEVEIAFVTLAPLSGPHSAVDLGLILCNDYTDRATLMRRIDPYDIESGQGFTTGKSFPGYLPVGDLFVIPRRLRTFIPRLQMQLDVDGGLRQRASAAEMVWDVDEILRQTWQRRDDHWLHHGSQVSLPFTGDSLAARTLILSGTPHGTVFDGMPRRFMAIGAWRWLVSGFDGPPAAQVMEAYIDAAGRARSYLQPEDRVTIHAPYLGTIRNRITR